ncbi:sensor domain-containing diguanylate cyclase [Acinetobacter radioresistens]|uniref:sensor domain-containing diguanylate cyclase n=1 Tax=Acinetobacter radioresistens TaxID=40216 RepID=UPI002006437B|nr:sensor domain-containing diguanylate cyclase [Acinetobacter radioresistens]MCK4107891.1 sensor domain-containing diguanylate cyclase [Acinetobacter radioresistens]
MNDLKFGSFEEAGQTVLEYLHKKIGFNLWMITRVEGKDWIVLQSEDHGYQVEPGQVFNWADSFCSHMVMGKTPKIAPRSKEVPLYASAPINKQVEIETYIGEPLVNEDGSVFGTLCAIDPSPKPAELVEHQDLIETFGKLLSLILQAELRENEHIRKNERLRLEALTDGLTGLYNRRAWDQLLTLEEDRCKRYGHPAAVLIVDLNNLKIINDTQGHRAGDELIQKTAEILRDNTRQNDVVARLGGDEFSILNVENDQAGVKALVKRLLKALKKAGINAAIGACMRHPSHGLHWAMMEADKKMYENKQLSKARLI